MSDETMRLAGGDELPVVGEVLAAVLTAQGVPGLRALELLEDARRVLTGGFLRRPAEVAESCLRGAADALLSLPGAPEAVGLKAAAAALLDAIDARPGLGPSRVPVGAADDGPLAAPNRPVPTGETGAAGRGPAAGPREPAAASRQSAVPPAATSAGGAGMNGAEECVRLREAADVLRGQLARPGGYHRARAAGIAERLMGVPLGAAQEEALGVWPELYAKTSGTLHGGVADPARAAALYRQLLAATRQLLVPLPGRAARVLELAALKEPGEAEARELAGWADPRATRFFFRSGPAAAWLPLLHQHAPYLLLADETAGVWPAAPFLEHLAIASPEAARPWLAAHAVPLAAAGPLVLGALLRLADAGTLTPADIQRLLPHVTARPPAGAPAEEASLERRLVAGWAGNLPMAVRDGDWLLVVEELLKDTVDLGHAGFLAYATARRRAHAGHEPLPELTEVLRREWAARLPDHDVTGLLRELVVTVHAGAGEPFRWARAVRGALAGLLRRDIEAPVRQSWPASVDLDEVHVLDARVFLGPVLDMGPLLARAVLDLAAADAAAGLPLAERMRAWPRIAAADAHLHDRVLAAHLAAHPPAPGTDTAGEGEWWDRAVEVTARLLAGRPIPEGARLAALVLNTCPPGRAADLNLRARAALGPAPAADEIDQALPAAPDAAQASGRTEPLASWLRIWAWSPVLPAPLLTGFASLLAALRRQGPAGPPDPRIAARPPSRHDTVVALEDLLELAAAAGPLAAAAALAGAPDAGADGYARVLQRLVGAAPAAWTADVPQVLAALARPELGAFYLAATARAARHPDAFPTGPAEAVLAALKLSRALPAPASPHVPDAAEFAGRAWLALLDFAWRTGGDLGGDLPAVLDHLHTLAEPLTRPAAPPPPAGAPATPAPRAAGPAGDRTAGDEEKLPAGLLDTHPAVRALDCLLDYAAGHATEDGAMPGDVLRLVADVLAARPDDEAVATVIGAHLPLLHRRATAFTADHPELYALDPQRPSPAAAWLDRGKTDPLLLAALDRGQLLAAVRANVYGAASRVAFALLLEEPPNLLGDPADTWRELAAGPDGAAAVSPLFMPLAFPLQGRPRAGDAAGDPAARAPKDIARAWWTAALEADLPPGALAGAGWFTLSAFTDEVWLPLARRSAEHTPAQDNADKVAERAAGHPRSPDALLLAAHLLTRPAPGPLYDADVRRHARALLRAATALPEAERPAEAEQLRRALVEAGEVDLAQTTDRPGAAASGMIEG
ncbi:hypothetical protein [Streptomyces sp. NBC_01264]|uniref:hypothetical protein n=1 Tax=Streptomyces sp. NBC_01264 TaxID=2903804 RepID=UPI00224F16C9|nr:hypothetical protein [Streptomyces sp. NBC_01264]MCX4783882.1 hypothetical protein [Streptomyces sp. NBC_01264]